MYDKYKSNVVSIIATFLFAALVITACCLLPLFVKMYLGDAYGTAGGIRTALFVCLYVSGASSLVISYLLLRVLFNIRKNVVFDKKNVRYARYISWCCFVECAAFFALGFFIPFSFAVSFAMAFIGLIVRVAKNLLNEATDIKEENDLTV